MSDQKVPDVPDYSPIITALNNINETSAANGKAALDWAKEQWASNKDLISQVNDGLLDLQSTFGQEAENNLTRSGSLLNEGEQRLLDNVDKYTSPERIAANMGAAQANVAQAFDAARNNSTRELESYGVNPAATRFGALDIGFRAQQAAAMAGAGNVSRRTDEALADAAIDKVVGQGNTRAGMAGQDASIASGAGTGAVNTSLAGTASGANTLGTGLAWTNPQLSALTGAASTQNQQFSNQAKADEISNSSSSGIGSLLGIGASMLGKGGAFGAGGALAFLEDGGPVPGDVTSGGAVPMEASPSRGAVTDDVNAKVNAGEFVIPKDVALWKGQEFFQKLIAQSRKANESAPAKPSVGAVPAGVDMASPAFHSRPAGGGALPMR